MGRGVFARVPIERGCFLAEYRGELISQHERSARQTKYSDKEKTFLFDFQWNSDYWW
jgi:SET domain-containing protein